MNSTQEQNLRNVIRALRESPNPEAFTMHYFAWGGCEGKAKFLCGNPACPLGHYAARTDLQNVFTIGPGKGHELSLPLLHNGKIVNLFSIEEVFQEHFGIDNLDVKELFSVNGCNNAKSVEEAISYIEWFIKRKLEET